MYKRSLKKQKMNCSIWNQNDVIRIYVYKLDFYLIYKKIRTLILTNKLVI